MISLAFVYRIVRRSYLLADLRDSLCSSHQVELPDKSSACLFVHRNLLVVHSYQYISKLKAGQLDSHRPIKYSNAPPAVDSTRYFTFRYLEVIRFTIETGEECPLRH